MRGEGPSFMMAADLFGVIRHALHNGMRIKSETITVEIPYGDHKGDQKGQLRRSGSPRPS
ncbi:hypothetical protein KTT_07490 [Tengunoibacter tsumagoiensis]|uniref:Uncharacterized protein n=1 Tax=Tengunoibacter tsumagoiensis TaxID=2014871 RepID=A0A401ZVV2_9CHLR|nr:hypothetical protein KTT_07490 [Tengunoibacter tsumagoiensis]